jgi:hypothetical protein
MSSQNLNYYKNTKKYHFYIGNVFNNPSDYKLLSKIQQKLKEKYSLKNYHWNNRFYTNFIYLGYMEQHVAETYMDNIISSLLKELTNKINPLKCSYTGYKLTFDKSFYKISLKFIDEDGLIEKIIVPYLHKNGIMKIYNKKKNILKPEIDLVYYKSSPKITEKNDISLFIPNENFTLDHLSLIKGIPIKVRPGGASKHDQMNIEEISRFNFPFGKKSIDEPKESTSLNPFF